MHGLIQSQPVGPGLSSRQRIPNSHRPINSGTHRLSHFWPLIFTPYISQKPLYLPKIVSQSPLFFPHCPKFWKFFTQRPQIGWNLRKKIHKCPVFTWLLSLQDPLFFALHAHLWEECCSLKHGLQKLENFVFLKQNRAIWWILLGANLIKVMKTKFQFYRLNRPNCTLWMNFIGGQGWYTGHHPSGQTRKEIYATTTLCSVHNLAL